MKKIVLAIFAALALIVNGVIVTKSVVEKNRDPWLEANLEALSATELFNTDCFLWTEEHVLGSGLPLVFVIDCRKCELVCIDFAQAPARCHK